MWKNRFILCAILIIGLLFAYSPLMYVVSSGLIQNSRGYWNQEFLFFGSHVTSSEQVKRIDSALFMGNTSNEQSLWASWKFNMFSLPFMTDHMKNVTDAYVLIKDSPPISVLHPFLYQSVFEDHSFTDGWQGGGGGATISTDGDVLTISPDNVNNWLSYYTLTENFSSSENNCVEVKVTNVSGGAIWKILMLVNGTWWGLFDINGEYIHSSPGVFIYHFPPNYQYTNPTIWVENGNKGLSGSVGIDYIKIGKLSASNIAVTLNNHNILSETLVLKKDDLFTLPLKYDTNFSIREQSGWLKISIDINSLKAETLMNITLDGYVSWRISSALIYLVTRTADIHPPAWQSIPYYMWLPITATSSGIVISLMLFNKLHKWIRCK